MDLNRNSRMLRRRLRLKAVMIDDSLVRQQILKNIPALEPWQIAMEEIDFGECIGVAVRLNHKLHRFNTRSYTKEGRSSPKTEDRIAFELSQKIRAVIAAIASMSDAPMSSTES